MPWWGSLDDASPRMIAEVKAMKQFFGRGKITKIDMQVPWDDPFWIKSEGLEYGFEDTQLYWLITIRFGRESTWPQEELDWEQETWVIKIFYPEGFWSQAPRAYIVRPRIFAAPHAMGRDGSLCLYNPQDGRSHGWDPSKGTGATIALWAIQWIRAYRYYQEYHDWPGPEHSVY